MMAVHLLVPSVLLRACCWQSWLRCLFDPISHHVRQPRHNPEGCQFWQLVPPCIKGLSLAKRLLRDSAWARPFGGPRISHNVCRLRYVQIENPQHRSIFTRFWLFLFRHAFDLAKSCTIERARSAQGARCSSFQPGLLVEFRPARFRLHLDLRQDLTLCYA